MLLAGNLTYQFSNYQTRGTDVHQGPSVSAPHAPKSEVLMLFMTQTEHHSAVPIKERRQPERWRELKKTDLPDFQLKPSALVAVPSDPRQRSERFFDSAEILAARISRLLSIPVLDLFSRDPFISSQKEMSRIDRLRWLRKCLHLRQPQTSVKRLLLIDDVMTSGASILRCLELIHDRCESLAVYSVARTLARTGQIKDK